MTKEQNMKRWLIMICIIIVIVAIAATAIITILKNNEDNTPKGIDKETQRKIDETIQNDLDVQIGNFQVNETLNEVSTKLVVTVKNKKEYVQSYSVKVEGVDSKGNVIAEDFAVANNLSAGETREIIAFKDVTKDKSDSLKGATFRIAKISVY